MSLVKPMVTSIVRPMITNLSGCRFVPTFNGVDQRMTIPDFQNSTGAFTFKASVIPSSVASMQLIIDSDTSNNHLRIQAGGQVRFRLTDTMAALKTVSSSFNLSVGVRYDIRCEVTPSQIELFVDNISQATVSLSDPITLTSNWNSIGASSAGSSPFNGSVFNVNLDNARNYKMNDGFANNPNGVDSISGQDGTFINMTSASWSELCE